MAATALFAFAPTASAVATTPQRINFQGRLTDASGNMVANGQYNMKFALYDAASSGTLKWSETRETTNRVTVTNGLFNVQLGSVNAFTDPTIFSTGSLYFEVTLANPATATCSTASCQTWESPMNRSQLATSAYAFNSETLDGIDSSGFIQNQTATTQTADFKINGSGTLDTLNASTSIKLGAASSSTGTLVLNNATNGNTVTIKAGATTANYALTLPTAVGASGDCLKAADASGTLAFSSCGASTLQQAYAISTSTELTLDSTRGGLTIRDNATPIGSNLLEVQNSGGTATYLGLTTTAMTLQDASANNAFLFDTSNSELRICENTTSPSRYVRMYYDTANNAAVFAASSGTTQIGTTNGAGDIAMTLSGSAADKLAATKTFTPAGAYSVSDFNFTRNLQGASYALGGNVFKIEDLSTVTSGSSSPNLLYINQQNASATGNLILAQTGGTADKFKVDTSGNVTAAGNLAAAGNITIGAGATYSGTGAVSLLSASNTNLTLAAGGAGKVIVKAGTDSTSIFEIQNAGGASMLTANSTNNLITLGVSDTTGTLLVLDTKTDSGDPTGVAGAMYYNANAGKMRCYENAWYDCVSREVLLQKTANQAATTSSTTFQNVTGLTFAIGASETYSFEVNMPVNISNTNADLKYTINAPAGSTVTAIGVVSTAAAASVTCGINTLAQVCAVTVSAAYRGVVTIQGVVTSSTTSGTVAVQFAQNTSNGSAGPTVLAGSTLKYKEL